MRDRNRDTGRGQTAWVTSLDIMEASSRTSFSVVDVSVTPRARGAISPKLPVNRHSWYAACVVVRRGPSIAQVEHRTYLDGISQLQALGFPYQAPVTPTSVRARMPDRR